MDMRSCEPSVCTAYNFFLFESISLLDVADGISASKADAWETFLSGWRALWSISVEEKNVRGMVGSTILF